jgi:hypothetical protein
MENYKLPAEGKTLHLRRLGRRISITGTGRDAWCVDSGGVCGELVRSDGRLAYRDQFGAIVAPERLMLAHCI